MQSRKSERDPSLLGIVCLVERHERPDGGARISRWRLSRFLGERVAGSSRSKRRERERSAGPDDRNPGTAEVPNPAAARAHRLDVGRPFRRNDSPQRLAARFPVTDRRPQTQPSDLRPPHVSPERLTSIDQPEDSGLEEFQPLQLFQLSQPLPHGFIASARRSLDVELQLLQLQLPTPPPAGPKTDPISSEQTGRSS